MDVRISKAAWNLYATLDPKLLHNMVGKVFANPGLYPDMVSPEAPRVAANGSKAGIVQNVRELLQDTVNPHQWSDSILCLLFDIGMVFLGYARPGAQEPTCADKTQEAHIIEYMVRNALCNCAELEIVRGASETPDAGGAMVLNYDEIEISRVDDRTMMASYMWRGQVVFSVRTIGSIDAGMTLRLTGINGTMQAMRM